MTGFEIEPAGPDLTPVASLYREIGFRPDLVNDLRFLRSLGGEVFVATRGGVAAGASSCLPLGRTGWIGGVAVAPTARRRGLGERLTAAALEALRAQGATTVLLHATPMARSLYARMGFESEDELVELTGPALRDRGGPCPEIRPGTPADLDAVLALDATATGEDRRRLLLALWEGGARVFDDGAIRGYHIHQLTSSSGAVVATEPRAGEALLAAALSHRPGPLRVPVPERAPHLAELLAPAGYWETARTTRMHHGPALLRRPALVYSCFNMFWG